MQIFLYLCSDFLTIMEKITKNQVKFVRGLGRKKERDEAGVFLAEGEKCVGELTGKFELVLRADSSNATALELEQMSQLRAPQGVVAVFRKPKEEPVSLAELAFRELVLALDGVQDPGNLGTIIRTADWFGVKHIFCSKDTADCWSPKVVQATMGALARVRVHYIDLVGVDSSRLWDVARRAKPVRGGCCAGETARRDSYGERGERPLSGSTESGDASAAHPAISRRRRDV